MAKEQTTALTSFREQLKADIAKARDTVDAPSSGGFINLKGKRFLLPDGTDLKQGPLSVIVLGHINHYSYYEGAYNPKNTQPPVCFAKGYNIETMEPSKNAPFRQSTSCAECPMAEWGSGQGNSKACKQQFTLAVIAADNIGPKSPILRINVSPTARKFWSNYIRTLSDANMMPVEVVTEISFTDAEYPQVDFTMMGPNPDLDACASLYEQAKEILEYDAEPRDKEAEAA